MDKMNNLITPNNSSNYINLNKIWSKKGNMIPTSWSPYPDLPGYDCKLPTTKEGFDNNTNLTYTYKTLSNEWDTQKHTESYCNPCSTPNDFRKLNNIWNGKPDPTYVIKNKLGYGVY
jgi:hypothetical protein